MEDSFMSHWWLLGAIICTLLFVLGVIGNALTIVILAKNKSLRCPSAYFISSLSASNLLVCLILVPVMIFDFLNYSNWELSEELCAVSSLIGYGNGPTSIIMIALLSFSSYVKITCTRSTAAKLLGKTRMWMMIIVGWSIGYGFTAAALFGVWGNIHVDEGTGYCINNGTIAGQKSEVFIAIAIFMIALLVISYSFIRIRNALSISKIGRHDDELVYAKMVFAVFSIYVLCYLIPSILLWAKKDYRSSGALYVTYRIPPLLSAIINPIIYYKMNEKYRAAYKNLRGCKAMEEVDFYREEQNLPM
ncbi:Hypothetical predicted protein [Cloeon dipterum]|uniref:G-protein coupled receptors family 1 profile domain-containing protein n=2 Tax=Cloeon dipterum TaxID=197152 RepID=A0A8S1D085_9INSE|nr:Hypothetical predicted protein [Cloeon dipterum]